MRCEAFIFVSNLHILNMFYIILTQTKIKSCMGSEITGYNNFPILDPTLLIESL